METYVIAAFREDFLGVQEFCMDCMEFIAFRSRCPYNHIVLRKVD